MDDGPLGIIEELAPPEISGEPGAWKQRQSVATKTALIETTIQSLAEVGYAKTNQQTIAERSGISRGGMQHHYPNPMDLIASAADLTFYRRCKWAAERIIAAKDGDYRKIYLDIVWQSMEMVEYDVYLELVIASRTDEPLRDMLSPKLQRFDSIWHDLIFRIQPEWKIDPKGFALANDIFRVVFDGLSLHGRIWRTSERSRALRDIFPSLFATAWDH